MIKKEIKAFEMNQLRKDLKKEINQCLKNISIYDIDNNFDKTVESILKNIIKNA